MKAPWWCASHLVVLISAFVVPNANAQERLSIDVDAYCKKTYGEGATFSHVRTDAYSWRCNLRGREYVVDMNAICKSQHGSQYSGELANPADSFTWYCVRK